MWSAPGLVGWPRPARLLASGGGLADWRVAAKLGAIRPVADEAISGAAIAAAVPAEWLSGHDRRGPLTAQVRPA
jgi:hypothetical protein